MVVMMVMMMITTVTMIVITLPRQPYISRAWEEGMRENIRARYQLFGGNRNFTVLDKHDNIKHFLGKMKKLKRSQSGLQKRTKLFQMESHSMTSVMRENIANASFIQFYHSLRFLSALGRLS